VNSAGQPAYRSDIMCVMRPESFGRPMPLRRNSKVDCFRLQSHNGSQTPVARSRPASRRGGSAPATG
jgi:hypothetical protein